MFLAACATTISSCPPIRNYPPAFQDRAAAELAALPSDSALGEMIADYKQLRDRVRLCR
jgi:hypothetical protein